MNEANIRACRFSAATLEATDAWQHSRAATGWAHHFEQLTPGPFFGRTREVCLGPLQVIHERLEQPFAYQGRPWKGSRVFLVSLPSGGDMYYDGRLMPSNVLATHRWDSTGRAEANGSVECAFVAVDEDFLTQYTQEAFGRRVFADARQALVASSDPAIVTRFRDCVLNLLLEVGQKPDVLLQEATRIRLQDQLLTMLLEVLEPRGHYADLPRPSTRAYVVDKAVEFINARLSQSIAFADLCKALRVSPRTLRYSFEEIVGVSPTRYLLARRLNGARQDLVRCGSQGTVEEIALRWGFWHMSRFAHFYRLTFGERPSETWGRACARPCARRTATRESGPRLAAEAFA